MEVTIKPMRPYHLDEVTAIERESFPQPWSRYAFLSELESNRFAHYLVACGEEEVLGYGGIWVVLDEAHITTLAVHPGYRGLGIGTLLLESLIALARQRSVERITLEVRPSNAPAQYLYRKYGFKVRGVRKRYYIDEDALIMWKESMD